MMYFLVIEFLSIWFQKEKQFCVLAKCPYQLQANLWKKENTKNKTSSLGTLRCIKSKLRTCMEYRILPRLESSYFTSAEMLFYPLPDPSPSAPGAPLPVLPPVLPLTCAVTRCSLRICSLWFPSSSCGRDDQRRSDGQQVRSPWEFFATFEATTLLGVTPVFFKNVMLAPCQTLPLHIPGVKQ
jgi:hypothetical protein